MDSLRTSRNGRNQVSFPILSLSHYLLRTESSDIATIVEEKISKVGGDPQIRKYSKGKMLGKGGFAKCYEFTSLETKKLTAAKIIVKSTLTKTRARQKVCSCLKLPR